MWELGKEKTLWELVEKKGKKYLLNSHICKYRVPTGHGILECQGISDPPLLVLVCQGILTISLKCPGKLSLTVSSSDIMQTT